MKGYEDIVATLLFLTVVMIGGYFYLDSLPKKQNSLQQAEKRVDLEAQPRPKIDLSKFEAAVKRTE